MKVAMVKAPTTQSQARGIGVYERELLATLAKRPGIETQETPFNFWRWDYAGFNLVHFLYFDLFFLTLPPWRNRKTIVTVMDMTPIVLSWLYPRGIRGEIKWQIQKWLLSRVDHILTLSKSARRDIVDIIGVPESRVSVTYLAAGENIRKLSQKREDFILYIGDINPNKNISALLRAMTILKERKLVLVGKALAEAVEIKREIAKLGIQGRVELKGYVSEEEKVSLLNAAGVYCQPSIYEGFGLPVLEAMKAGVPVVCGRNSSLPEVAGEAAVYADVSSPADLAEKINSVFRMSKSEREKVIDDGLSQAAKFSWTKTARETVGAYEKVLAGV